MHTYMHAYIHTYIHIRTYVHICITYICMCTCKNVHMYTYIHMDTHLYVHIHTYIYIFVFTCKYVYTQVYDHLYGAASRTPVASPPGSRLRVVPNMAPARPVHGLDLPKNRPYVLSKEKAGQQTETLNDPSYRSWRNNVLMNCSSHKDANLNCQVLLPTQNIATNSGNTDYHQKLICSGTSM